MENEEMDAAGGPSPLPEDESVEKYDRETIRKYVNKLDDTYRLPIILYYFKEIVFAIRGVYTTHLKNLLRIMLTYY